MPAILLTIMLLVGPFVEPAAKVDFGPWNGVVDCESGGDNDAVNASSAAAGLFQFIPTTWAATIADMGRPDLAGSPTSATVRDQWLAAEHLLTIAGIGQWSCGWRYGDGTGPIVVRGGTFTSSPP